MRAFLYDLILGVALILAIVLTFAATSGCSEQYTKPNIGWDATVYAAGDSEDTTAGMAGSLEAGVFQMDAESAIYISDSIITLLEFRADFLLFYSLDLHHTITCDMVTENCSICVYIPRIWPSEICYDNE